ncbi:hypothetical protein ACHAWF_009894, partial [Thalassiosira exigua]
RLEVQVPIAPPSAAPAPRVGRSSSSSSSSALPEALQVLDLLVQLGVVDLIRRRDLRLELALEPVPLGLDGVAPSTEPIALGQDNGRDRAVVAGLLGGRGGGSLGLGGRAGERVARGRGLGIQHGPQGVGIGRQAVGRVVGRARSSRSVAAGSGSRELAAATGRYRRSSRGAVVHHDDSAIKSRRGFGSKKLCFSFLMGVVKSSLK